MHGSTTLKFSGVSLIAYVLKISASIWNLLLRSCPKFSYKMCLSFFYSLYIYGFVQASDNAYIDPCITCNDLIRSYLWGKCFWLSFPILIYIYFRIVLVYSISPWRGTCQSLSYQLVPCLSGCIWAITSNFVYKPCWEYCCNIFSLSIEWSTFCVLPRYLIGPWEMMK